MADFSVTNSSRRQRIVTGIRINAGDTTNLLDPKYGLTQVRVIQDFAKNSDDYSAKGSQTYTATLVGITHRHGPFFQILKRVGTASRTLFADYCLVEKNNTKSMTSDFI